MGRRLPVVGCWLLGDGDEDPELGVYSYSDIYVTRMDVGFSEGDEINDSRARFWCFALLLHVVLLLGDIMGAPLDQKRLKSALSPIGLE